MSSTLNDDGKKGTLEPAQLAEDARRCPPHCWFYRSPFEFFDLSGSLAEGVAASGDPEGQKKSHHAPVAEHASPVCSAQYHQKMVPFFLGVMTKNPVTNLSSEATQMDYGNTNTVENNFLTSGNQNQINIAFTAQQVAMPQHLGDLPFQRNTVAFTANEMSRADTFLPHVYSIVGPPYQTPYLSPWHNVKNLMLLPEHSLSDLNTGFRCVLGEQSPSLNAVCSVFSGNNDEAWIRYAQQRSTESCRACPTLSASPSSLIFYNTQQPVVGSNTFSQTRLNSHKWVDWSTVNIYRKHLNVHGDLRAILRYVPYSLQLPLDKPLALCNDFSPAKKKNSDRVKSFANIVGDGLIGSQILPIFVRMFPCELRDRTVIVLNRVIEATCSLDSATVVGIEPRSETSFIALVRTNSVWQLIHKLRCRVLMDRHGFWYAENMEQYRRLKEYCEGVRRLPQQIRHLQTDGLPCMPLVVELSHSVDPAAVTSPQAPPPFDEVEPIATVERHHSRRQSY